MQGCLYPVRSVEKGIGGLLLEHIKEQRFPLTLHVYSRNAGAVQFYERHGFGTVSAYIDPETGQPERGDDFPSPVITPEIRA